jgi:hypothetical protein
MFTNRSGLIDQMYRSQELMKLSSDPNVADGLTYRHRCLGQVLANTFALTPPPNVDISAPDQDWVTALRSAVNVVTAGFDAAATPDNTNRFMMCIAWHEGDRLTQRIQQQGAGLTSAVRSTFQHRRRSAGDVDTLKQQFKDHGAQVDPLLPLLSV